MNRAVLVERIAELVNEKIITDITAVRDESDENTRVVIEIKRDAIPKVVINNLYQAHRAGIQFRGQCAGHRSRPAQDAGLKELINCYIEHRREVIIRRTRFELRKAEERAETAGRLSDRPVATWTNSSASSAVPRNREEAKIKLLAFEFTAPQVENARDS